MIHHVLSGDHRRTMELASDAAEASRDAHHGGFNVARDHYALEAAQMARSCGCPVAAWPTEVVAAALMSDEGER